MRKLIREKERLLNITLDGLEKEYPRGMYDWLYTHNRGTYNEISRLEDNVNESFLHSGPLPVFKEMLREYWKVHMEVIKLYLESGAYQK